MPGGEADFLSTAHVGVSGEAHKIMVLTFDTDDFPPDERFDRFREMINNQPMPVDLGGSIRGRFTARLDATDLGIVTVTRLRQHVDGIIDVRRTPRLILRSDPQAYRP